MMKVYLFNHPERISEAQFQKELLPQLPAWRQETALRFKFHLGRVLCAMAFILLKDGLKNDFGIDGPITFDYGDKGKPFLRNHPEIHFNLSHCKQGVLCVIDDQAPVGCDIETLNRKVSDALMRRTCNAAELEAIQHADDPTAAFIRLWTIKEAVLKCSGEGITNDLKNLLNPNAIENLHIETKVCQENGYAYTICQKRAMK